MDYVSKRIELEVLFAKADPTNGGAGFLTAPYRAGKAQMNGARRFAEGVVGKQLFGLFWNRAVMKTEPELINLFQQYGIASSAEEGKDAVSKIDCLDNLGFPFMSRFGMAFEGELSLGISRVSNQQGAVAYSIYVTRPFNASD